MSSTYINSVIQEPTDTDSLMAFNNAQTLELRAEMGPAGVGGGVGGPSGVSGGRGMTSSRSGTNRYAGELVIGGRPKFFIPI